MPGRFSGYYLGPAAATEETVSHCPQRWGWEQTVTNLKAGLLSLLPLGWESLGFTVCALLWKPPQSTPRLSLPQSSLHLLVRGQPSIYVHAHLS